MVIKNARLISELSGNLPFELADIETKGDFIKSITKSGSILTDVHGTLDLEGQYVLPGFFDLHVHIGLSGGSTLEDNIRPVARQVLDGLRFAQDSLRGGFTTIRDVGSANGVAIGVRDAIKDGFFPGPNIIASGKILTPTETGNDYFAGLYAEFDGRSSAIKCARDQFQSGADYIKAMGSGAFMNPGVDTPHS